MAAEGPYQGSTRRATRGRTWWRSVTNATEMSARAIVANYEGRWAIELLFKELPGTFELGQYQMQKRGGLNGARICAVWPIWRWPIWRCSTTPFELSAHKPNKDVPLPRFQERLDAMHREIREDYIECFVGRIRRGQIRRCIREYLFAS